MKSLNSYLSIPRAIWSYGITFTWVLIIILPLCIGCPYLTHAANKGPKIGKIEMNDDRIRVPIDIDQPLEFKSQGNMTSVSLEGFSVNGTPGAPKIPMHRFKVLLPPDVKIESINPKIMNQEWKAVPGTFDLPPNMPPARSGLSTPQNNAQADAPSSGPVGSTYRNSEVYEKNEWYPASPLGSVKPAKSRQFHLISINFYPVRYNSITKKVQRLTAATLEVRYKLKNAQKAAKGKTGESSKLLDRGLRRLKDRVINPEGFNRFYPSSPSDQTPEPNETSMNNEEDVEESDSDLELQTAEEQDTDYIIITTSDIQAAIDTALSDFSEFKTNLGHNVAIITEAITADDQHYAQGGSAAERAENIRNWLQGRYMSWGIEYVLLIGRPDPQDYAEGFQNQSVPMLPAYPSSSDSTIVLTDTCYAELSGDWDMDDDGRPGEWEDDFGSGGIDREFEVAVGRIPYYSAAAAEQILYKSISYGEASGSQSWRERMLIAGAILNHAPQEDEQGGFDDSIYRSFSDNWGDEMAELAAANGFMDYKLYEKEGVYDDGTAYPLASCDAPLSQSNFISEWSSSPCGFVAWNGHGEYDGTYRRIWTNDNDYDYITQHPEETSTSPFIETSDANSLDNNYPAFVVQSACLNGNPENPDNLGYALLENGAVGTIAASEVSWYRPGTWDTTLGESVGDNASYPYYIFQQMIENETPIGLALNEAKSAFGMGWGESSFSASWWNCLDFNLRGDPGLSQVPPAQPTCTDADGDGYYAEPDCGTEVDCNDGDASINPGALEDCGNGLDNDCDGYVDGEDYDCDYFIKEVQKIYIAYYLRPADPAGLSYWKQKLEISGGDLSAIIEAFANSQESSELWGEVNSSNIESFIHDVYSVLFARNADSEGLEFYKEGFNSGRFTAATLVLDILNGAREKDLDAIVNKINYANKFVEILDPDRDGEGPFQATYTGTEDMKNGKLLLKEITSAPGSRKVKCEVKQDIIKYIADPGDPITD